MLKMHVRRTQRLMRLVWHVMVGAGISYLILLPLNAMGRDSQRPHQRMIVRWWMAKTCRILNLRIQKAGVMSATPTLFVANHISWLDIPCLAAALDAVCVSKHEVRRWPVVGGMAAQAGTVFIQRGAHAASGVADLMARNLMDKRSVVFFPEGTSTSGATVRNFHPRLYQAAIHAQTVVQAVAISYPHPAGVNPVAPYINDDNLLHHLWVLLKEPSVEVNLTFCPPVPAESGRRALAVDTRSQILSALKKTPGYAGNK
ncbi:MAG: 1-acyl-sn-glycerol-3-phosphate acyltransferase [Gammaproteobacteria bacterium]|nr:1-acyl-sn-glycerol-3-phosphate acyltransferase [Gammaproteobacteria bacterium]